MYPSHDNAERPPHPRAVELAGVIADLAVQNGGRATRDQLLDAGFRPREIDAYLDDARALAARMRREKAPPYGAALGPIPKLGRNRRREIARDRRDAIRAEGGAR
ncbi:MAG: hypothetical protein NBV67_00260 [Tagaea sp.]|nr:hypothetical protein [Tagaea sp.]